MGHRHAGFLLLNVGDCGLAVQRLPLGSQFCEGIVESGELLVPCMKKIFEENLVLLETAILWGGGKNSEQWTGVGQSHDFSARENP